MTDPGEANAVQTLFRSLITAPLREFPRAGPPSVERESGVYVVYDLNGAVLHVGRTTKGTLRNRLNNHLHGQSSFTRSFVAPRQLDVRSACRFRYLVVPDARRGALLEAHAIGRLCPAHLGTGSD
jgi:excinuclease UvrABC nuclease subunit